MEFKQPISREIFERKYCLHGETSPEQVFMEIAKEIASVEPQKEQADIWENIFYDAMASGEFMPAGRVLANARLYSLLKNYNNCFTIDLLDSMVGIYGPVAEDAVIGQVGGGVGFNASKLRPKGARISKGGESSGVMSFLEVFDASAKAIHTGGGRRGAHIAILNVWHPDIEEFIEYKKGRENNALTQFNISVGITDEFMNCVIEDRDWNLVFPLMKFEKREENTTVWMPNPFDVEYCREQGYILDENDNLLMKVYKTVKARDLYDRMTKQAWWYNEPGVLFLDTVERENNAQHAFKVDRCNPCVAKGTLVNTPYGYRKVEEIKEGDLVCSLHKNGYEPVKTVEVHEDTFVNKVVFSDGTVQYITDAHIYHVKDRNSNRIKRVRFDSLKIGDKIQHQPTEILGEIHANSWEYKKALLAGVLLGDGCYTEKTIEANNNIKISTSVDDVEYNSNLISLIKELGYKVGEVYCDGKSRSATISVSNAEEVLKDLGLMKLKSFEKEIPDFYLNNKDRIAGVINGLLATDGNVLVRSGSMPLVRFKTSSEKLYTSYRRALLNLGVKCGMYYGDKDKQTSGIIDGRQIERKHSTYEAYTSGEFAKKLIKSLPNNINPKKQDKMNEILYNYITNGNNHFLEIVEIDWHVRKDTVYDLFCEESDTWITEGLVQQGCGEIVMPAYSLCCLSAINISKLVKNSFTDKSEFDLDRFKELVRIGVRFLDNVLDATDYPLEKIEKISKMWRRIGLGVTGVGDALMKLRIRYGNIDSVKLIDWLSNHMANEAYRYSVELAKEKGSFPAFDENIGEFGFIKKLDEDIQRDIKKYGLRNIGLLTIAPTGCLVPESIVHTSDGLLTLDELIPNYKDYEDGTWIPKERLGALNEREFYKEVKNTFVNGFKPTKKVFTKSGVDIEGTPNHKFRVLDRSKTDEFIWKELQELSVGDNIVYKIGGYERKENKRLILPDYARHPNEKDINLPKEITPEFAFFLGLYNADGSTHNKGIRINLNHLSNEVIEVVELIKNLFNWDSGIVDNGRNCDSVYISSQRLLNFLEINDLIKNKALDINIPKAVRQSSKESILSYLDGYFYGDGSSTGNTMYIDTYSKKNAQQLAIVMRAVGINSSITTYDKSLDENSFSNNLAYRVYWKKYGSIGEERVERYIKKDLKDKVKYLRNFGNGLFIDEVVSVEDSNNYTLDLEVPDGRTYIANSYVSHNTTSLTIGNNCSSGIEPIFSLQYDRTIRQDDDTLKTQTVYDDGWLEYIEHTGYKEGDELPDYVVVSHDVSIKEGIDIQSAFQKWIDHSISKTINMPFETTLDEYKDIFMYSWKKGLKGTTSFHEGASMDGILSTKPKKEEKEEVWKTIEVLKNSTKRPDELSCDIFEIQVNKEPVIVLVGKNPDAPYNNAPYEIFYTDNSDGIIDLNKAKEGKIVKIADGKEKPSRYDLVIEGKRSEFVLKDLAETFNDDYATMCRLLSLSMRHQIPLEFIVAQMNKVKKFGTFQKAIARVLKKYIPDGEMISSNKAKCPECGGTMVFDAGCTVCSNCGHSTCG